MSSNDSIFARPSPSGHSGGRPLPRTRGRRILRRRSDVAIIGGGIDGLSTAYWNLGRNGIAAVVLDREPIGWGASSRNGGALSGAAGLGRARPDLQQAVDPSILTAMVDEAEQSFDDFRASGRTGGTRLRLSPDRPVSSAPTRPPRWRRCAAGRRC